MKMPYSATQIISLSGIASSFIASRTGRSSDLSLISLITIVSSDERNISVMNSSIIPPREFIIACITVVGNIEPVTFAIYESAIPAAAV